MIERLENENQISVIDLGVYREDEVYDPQGLGDRAAISLNNGSCDCCILLSSTGNGLQMFANKHEHVAAVPCFDKETAIIAVKEFNANMLDIPSFTPEENMNSIVDAFLFAIRK